MLSDAYESHLVGLFMQLWGRAESESEEPATLLTNAQNPFDNWFGDICGVVRHRYFLIEFKKVREGFSNEVQGSTAKHHRAALYQHLRADEDCRTIARFGHFAAYAADSGGLTFEPYAHSIAPRRSKQELVTTTLESDEPWAELDYTAWTFNFRKFYEALHVTDLSLHRESPPWLFVNGLGIPEADLEQYVSCLYSHLHYQEEDEDVILLGAFHPNTNEFKAVALPPFQMVIKLKEKFETLRAAMAQEIADQRSEDKNPGFRP